MGPRPPKFFLQGKEEGRGPGLYIECAGVLPVRLARTPLATGNVESIRRGFNNTFDHPFDGTQDRPPFRLLSQEGGRNEVWGTPFDRLRTGPQTPGNPNKSRVSG